MMHRFESLPTRRAFPCAFLRLLTLFCIGILAVFPKVSEVVSIYSFELLQAKIAEGTYLNTRKLCSAVYSAKLRG